MPKSSFEEHMSNSMKKLKIPASEKVWEGVEAGLAKKKRNKRWLIILFLIAFFVGILSIFLFQRPFEKDQQDSTSHINETDSLKNAPDSKTYITDINKSKDKLQPDSIQRPDLGINTVDELQINKELIGTKIKKTEPLTALLQRGNERELNHSKVKKQRTVSVNKSEKSKKSEILNTAHEIDPAQLPHIVHDKNNPILMPSHTKIERPVRTEIPAEEDQLRDMALKADEVSTEKSRNKNHSQLAEFPGIENKNGKPVSLRKEDDGTLKTLADTLVKIEENNTVNDVTDLKAKTVKSDKRSTDKNGDRTIIVSIIAAAGRSVIHSGSSSQNKIFSNPNSSGGTADPLNRFENRPKPGLTVNPGISLDKSLSNKWKLTSGLYYKFTENDLNVGQRVDSAKTFAYGNGKQLTAENFYRNGNANVQRNSFHSLEIPILIGFSAGKKNILSFQSGISTRFLLKGSGLIYNDLSTNYFKEKSLYAPVVFSFNAGVAYKFGGQNKLSVIAGLIFSSDLNSIIKTTYDRQLSQSMNLFLKIPIKKLSTPYNVLSTKIVNNKN